MQENPSICDWRWTGCQSIFKAGGCILQWQYGYTTFQICRTYSRELFLFILDLDFHCWCVFFEDGGSLRKFVLQYLFVSIWYVVKLTIFVWKVHFMLGGAVPLAKIWETTRDCLVFCLIKRQICIKSLCCSADGRIKSGEKCRIYLFWFAKRWNTSFVDW